MLRRICSTRRIRKLTASRREPPALKTTKITVSAELLALINTLNAEGVRQYGQLSPDELISRMETASRESAEYHQALDPFAPAMFPVSWAGEEESANWFDTAREFTERWHHQQQIRLAVNKPGIMTREIYYPVLDCFMRALPYAYRDVPAKSGTIAQFNISGECGGSWFLFRDGGAWTLNASPVGRKNFRRRRSRRKSPGASSQREFREKLQSQVQSAGDLKSDSTS